MPWEHNDVITTDLSAVSDSFKTIVLHVIDFKASGCVAKG